MLNALRQNLSPREHPIRFAILMVLAGIAIDRAILSDENAEDQRGVITGALNSDQESGGKSPVEPETGGSEKEPDHDELKWGQCRKLVFNVIGSKCQELSDEEMVARAREARARIAQRIMDDFEIADEDLQEQVMQKVTEGYTIVQSYENGVLTLSNPDDPFGGSTYTIDLEDIEEDAEEDDFLSGAAPEFFIKNFDMRQLSRAVINAGLEGDLGEVMGVLEEVQQEFVRAEIPVAKDLAICRFFYRIMRLSGDAPERLLDSFADRPELHEGFHFIGALIKFFEGRDEEEVCLEVLDFMFESPLDMPGSEQ